MGVGIVISALVSQARGLAVFDDGESLAVLLGEDAEPEVRGASELSRLLRGASDIEALSLPGLPDLRAALHERRLREEALHAALLLIDGESSMALRGKAATTLARVLSAELRSWPVIADENGQAETRAARPNVIERWVEGVLMSTPAPPEVDFSGAQALLPGDTGILIRRVEEHQPRIRAVCSAFVAGCRKLGVSPRSPLRRRAVDLGWFRALVLGEIVFLGESDEAWELFEEWISILVEMMSNHAVMVRPAGTPHAPSGEPELSDDAGWVVWPLQVEGIDSLRETLAADRGEPPVESERASRRDEDTVRTTPVLLEDLNLPRTERLLCEAALRRAGSIVEAARLLGITRHSLKQRMLKHRIAWPLVTGVQPPSWTDLKVAVDKRVEVGELALILRPKTHGDN
jgi:Bacterial regulatory protein, Fis family